MKLFCNSLMIVEKLSWSCLNVVKIFKMMVPLIRIVLILTHTWNTLIFCILQPWFPPTQFFSSNLKKNGRHIFNLKSRLRNKNNLFTSLSLGGCVEWWLGGLLDQMKRKPIEIKIDLRLSLEKIKTWTKLYLHLDKKILMIFHL